MGRELFERKYGIEYLHCGGLYFVFFLIITDSGKGSYWSLSDISELNITSWSEMKGRNSDTSE